MNILIYNESDLFELSMSPFDDKTAIISIGDSNSGLLDLKYYSKYFLRLTFDDADPVDWMFDVSDTKLITEVQTRQIADFVYMSKDNIDTLICQCKYGISRSPAVAAAVSEHFYHNGITIYADDNFYPNKYVYRMVYQCLEEYKSQRNN